MQLDAVARDQILSSLRQTLSRRSRVVDDLREVAKGTPVTLAAYLDQTGRDVEDVYAAGGWTTIRREAGLLPERANVEEDNTSERLGRPLHVDEPTRLATQNPMDLDYRALSNAGLWFIGRLQTDADRARVIDGLEGALGAADEDLASTLTRLAPRWFVVKNARATSPPVLVQTALCDESHARADVSHVLGARLPSVVSIVVCCSNLSMSLERGLQRGTSLRTASRTDDYFFRGSYVARARPFCRSGSR